MANLLAYGTQIVGGGGNSQSGGGHVIVDASGTELTQEEKLKFTGGLKTTDDSTNGQTIVDDSPTEIEWSVWNTMTEQEKAAIPKALVVNAPGVDGPIDVELIKTLWTNPSPTAEFAAQTITLSISDYDFLLVNFAYANDNNFQSSIIAPKGHDFTIEMTSPLSNGRLLNISRNVTYVSATSLSISDGTRATSYDSESSAIQNIRCIPTVIYGIKTSVTVDVSGVISDVSTDASKCILTNGNNIEKIIRNTNLSSKYADSLSITNVNNCPPGLCSSEFTTNTPTGNTENLYVFSMAMNEDMDYCKQIAWSMTDNSKIYTRQCFSGLWGAWDVLETNSRTAVVTGTLSSDSAFASVSFPSGFNKDNCMVTSWMIEATSEGWRTGQGIISDSSYRTFVMISSSVQIYNNNPSLYSKPFKIMLKKI